MYLNKSTPGTVLSKLTVTIFQKKQPAINAIFINGGLLYYFLISH